MLLRANALIKINTIQSLLCFDKTKWLLLQTLLVCVREGHSASTHCPHIVLVSALSSSSKYLVHLLPPTYSAETAVLV